MIFAIAVLLLIGVLSAEALAEAKPGTSAADFKMTTTSGEQVTLSELKGRVVVINFWASWCPGCIYEFPGLNRLADKLSDIPVTFVALSEDINPQDMTGFLQKQKPLFMNVAWDVNGIIAGSYGVNALPTTIVVDKRGIIRMFQLGYRPGDEKKIEDLVNELLK